MPRKIQPKCLECSRLSAQAAQQLHGEQGDGCWNAKICPRRRSHYRHRAEKNAQRRGQRAVAKTTKMGRAAVETIIVPVQLSPVALIYLYREARKDAHLHAIALTVWRGEEKLAEVKPIHCLGMTNSQVNRYLREALKVLNQRYGITEFEPEIRLEPLECPIDPCPLKTR
ncbi:MAG TPA: hypothetical protein V6C57_19260 [Coleofasciculaceae cyanobacterium]